MTLFEEALNQFDEAGMELYRIVYSGGKQNGAKREAATEKYTRKRRAILDYVAALEAERQLNLARLIEIQNLTPPKLVYREGVEL